MRHLCQTRQTDMVNCVCAQGVTKWIRLSLSKVQILPTMESGNVLDIATPADLLNSGLW